MIPGQLRIGNWTVLNISRASELVSDGKTASKVIPNALPISKVTQVTVEGADFETNTNTISTRH